VAGRIANFAFREGERVARGQVLVKLDDSVQQADLDRAQANLTLSKSKHDRATDLRNKGFVSTQALDESENTLKVAAADAELMKARVNKMTLRAPFSGTIGLRQASVGDYVKEGQDIVNLESLDPLKVDFRLPELALSQLQNGQALQIALDALPDRTYEGKVYAINPLIDANGRSIVIRAQVPNRDGKLRPACSRACASSPAASRTARDPEEALFPWATTSTSTRSSTARRSARRSRSAAPRGPRRDRERPRPRGRRGDRRRDQAARGRGGDDRQQRRAGARRQAATTAAKPKG
jgi:membrane fusion protein (multidrug efflux system)